MTTAAPDRIPALVMGSSVTVLGVIRLLGRRGIPLAVHLPDDDPVRASRWYRPPPGSPSLESGLAAFLEELDLDRAVVVPCSDDLALEAARLPPELSTRFPSFQSAPEALETFVDKGRFLDALDRHDIPHPRTTLVERAEDLAAIPDEELARSFIKPRDSQHFFQEYGRKALWPADRGEFERELHRVLDAGHALMVQRYVPGPASNHYFIDGFADEPGRVHTLLARRRLRMYPSDFGNSSYMVTVAPDDAAPAIASVAHLVEKLRVRGTFSAEFKRDARDGTFRILEVNARPWWYIEFAAQAGLDFAFMVYERARGLEVSTPRDAGYEVGRALAFPYYDYSACREEAPSLFAALRMMARDWPGAEQPVFSWSDPMPALRDAVRRIPGMLKRRLTGEAGRTAAELRRGAERKRSRSRGSDRSEGETHSGGSRAERASELEPDAGTRGGA